MTASRTQTDDQSRKPRVLVIDDEESNLETFERVFRRDFQMMVARSVEDGALLAQRHAFDVALVDYAMPYANGVEFLRLAPSIQPTMACMMLTAYADLDDVKEAYAAGLARAIIMKPWEKDAILRWVGNAHRMASLKRSVDVMNGAITRK